MTFLILKKSEQNRDCFLRRKNKYESGVPKKIFLRLICATLDLSKLTYYFTVQMPWIK